MEQSYQQLKRSIAFKVALSDVTTLPFVKGDGSNSSYLQHEEEQITRVNVIGTIIQKRDNMSMAIDDNSSPMLLRVFEDKGLLQNMEIGDVVLTVGRPREYGTERYILPEIVKKVDAAWLKVRGKELSSMKKMIVVQNVSDGAQHQSMEKETEEIEKTEMESKAPSERICSYIKSNDKGEGVDIEDIVGSHVVDNVETHVAKLLKNGDIFEIRPGRVKVLE